MKFFIVLAVIASTTALPYGGLVNTGASAVSSSTDGLGNYAFGYNEDHATGGTFRKEKGGPGVQVGSYGLRDADGRIRVVNYVADALGFRASVSTNEPGVDVKQDPAATSLSIGGHIAAPLVAPVLAAPVAHGIPLGYGHGAPLGYGHGPISYGASIAHAAPLGHYGAPLAHGPVYGHGLGHY